MLKNDLGFKDTHALILNTCNYVTRRDFPDHTKISTLKQGDYPDLSG